MELPKEPRKKGVFDEAELAFIKQNAQKLTDVQIGEVLNRDPLGITKQRQRLGIVKRNGRPSIAERFGKEAASKKKIEKSIDTLGDMEVSVNKKDKQKLAERLFKKSEDYERFSKQLTEEEMKKFTRMFSEYLAEWEKILPQEKEQLHNVLKEVVIQDRTLAQIKQNEEIFNDLAKLESELLSLIKNPNRSEDQNARVKELKEYTRDMRTNIVPQEALMKVYDESVKRQKDITKQLGMSREDRLKRDSDRGLTLVSIVQAMSEKETRKKAGDECASIIQQIEKKKVEMSKKGILSGDI